MSGLGGGVKCYTAFMSILTVEIQKEGAAALDGTTLLDLSDDTNVAQNRVSNQTLLITVSGAVSLGAVDLAQFLLPDGVQTTEAQQGGPALLLRATSTSSGGAYAAGAYTRRGPTLGGVTNVVQLQTLALNGGQYLSAPRLFPIDHLLGIDSGGVAGPHRLVLVLKTFEDIDSRRAA